MSRRELDEIELGRRVDLSLHIDNELTHLARLAALVVRFAEAHSKDRNND